MILYNVNKEKRIVVARFKGMERAVDASLKQALDPFDYGDVMTVLLKFDRAGRYNMTGIAICHEDDTWDEKIGKKIAKNRLLRQYHVLLHEVLLGVKKEIEKDYVYQMNKLNSRINKYIKNSKKFKNDVNKYVKPSVAIE
jgi:uncharacterized protein YciU (UPF0263 family)